MCTPSVSFTCLVCTLPSWVSKLLQIPVIYGFRAHSCGPSVSALYTALSLQAWLTKHPGSCWYTLELPSPSHSSSPQCSFHLMKHLLFTSVCPPQKNSSGVVKFIRAILEKSEKWSSRMFSVFCHDTGFPYTVALGDTRASMRRGNFQNPWLVECC